jgi:hypothetical protein
MRDELPESSEQPSSKTLPSATDGRVAAEIALAPLTQNEGARIGILGDSGCGKTEAARRIVAEYVKRVANGIVLCVDDKEAQAQYYGQERRDRYDLERRPLDGSGPRVVVFRGDPFETSAGEVDPEEIAEIQRKLAMNGRPSMVVYDELDKAANMAMWKRGDASAIRWSFIKGRNVGAASLWGTQETQAVPREAFNQSSCILCFRLVGNPLRLLRERGYLEGGDVAAVISALPGDELPRNKRGYFVLLRRGRPWDGRIYRF